MNRIETVTELRALYADPVPGAIAKVVDQITPHYRRWIDASRFVILSTVGEEGTDASPRGDIGPVVHVVDAHTLWLPDWRGNNRLDSLENIVRDGRVSLMFMIPGSNNVVRINGRAVLTDDAEVIGHFERKGKTPRTVIVVEVGEVYFQCAKALMRSQLWLPVEQIPDIPTAGEFIRELDETFDAKAYDDGYPEYAKPRMW